MDRVREHVEVAQVGAPQAAIPLLVRGGHVRRGGGAIGVGGVERHPALAELVMGAPELRLPRRDPCADGLAAGHEPAAARSVVGHAVRCEAGRDGVDVVLVDVFAVEREQVGDPGPVLDAHQVSSRRRGRTSRPNAASLRSATSSGSG